MARGLDDMQAGGRGYIYGRQFDTLTYQLAEAGTYHVSGSHALSQTVAGFVDVGTGMVSGAAAAGTLARTAKLARFGRLASRLDSVADATRVARTASRIDDFAELAPGGICFVSGTPVVAPADAKKWYALAGGIVLAGIGGSVAAEHFETKRRKRREEELDEYFAQIDGSSDGDAAGLPPGCEIGEVADFDELCDQLFNADHDFWSEGGQS
jgi:hypothetical protein